MYVNRPFEKYTPSANGDKDPGTSPLSTIHKASEFLGVACTIHGISGIEPEARCKSFTERWTAHYTWGCRDSRKNVPLPSCHSGKLFKPWNASSTCSHKRRRQHVVCSVIHIQCESMIHKLSTLSKGKKEALVDQHLWLAYTCRCRWICY